MEQFLGQEKEVLFEEQQTVEGQEYWTGHTMEYLKIAVISEENLENKRVMVQLREMIGQGFRSCRTVKNRNWQKCYKTDK